MSDLAAPPPLAETDAPAPAPIAEPDAPPAPKSYRCRHCKRPGVLDPANWKTGVGTLWGPSCNSCRARFPVEPDSFRGATWAPGDEPDRPIGDAIRTPRENAAAIFEKVRSWTPFMAPLKWRDLINAKMALQHVVPFERFESMSQGFMGKQCGFTDAEINRFGRPGGADLSLGSTGSVALQFVVLSYFLAEEGRSIKDWVRLKAREEAPEATGYGLSPVGGDTVSRETSLQNGQESVGGDVQAMIAEWTDLADKMLDLDSWPEEEDEKHARRMNLLSGKINNRLVASQDGAKGAHFVARAIALVAGRVQARALA